MVEDLTSALCPDRAAVEYRSVPDLPAYRVGDDGSVWSRWSRIWPRGQGRGACGFGIGTEWVWMKRALGNGYPSVQLYGSGRHWQVNVPVLVLVVFIGPRPEGMEVCHENGIRTDNRLANLRWGTRKSNHLD